MFTNVYKSLQIFTRDYSAQNPLLKINLIQCLDGYSASFVDDEAAIAQFDNHAARGGNNGPMNVAGQKWRNEKY